MNRILKRALCAILLLIFPFSLCSCMDLGDIADEAEYGEDFTVSFMKGTSTYTDEYKINEFFNKETVENLKSPISSYEYKYMFIENTSDSDLKLEDFYFYIDTDKDVKFQYKAWVLSSESLPKTLINMDDNYELLKDYLEKKAKGESVTLDLPSNNEPTTTPVAAGSALIKTDQRNWNDITVKWSGSRTCSLPKDSYLVVQFTNNTGAGFDFSESKDIEQLKQEIQERKESVSTINITNIIIRIKKQSE